ncbi:MAG: WxL domain-containing protein [Lactobacillales bacterium]|jgi:hypothetical protein|nr:WxL domain-containing protein [Lactobacillales bacterium]
MDFKYLKLPLCTVATLSLLVPANVLAAESTNTDGKVTFELDSSDLEIVQPGTNTHLLVDTTTDGKVGKSGLKVEQDDGEGFVKLLFAPNFDFGKVKANYKNDSTYSVQKIYAQADSKEGGAARTAGYLNPFAQVADFTNGDYNWDLSLTLNSQFVNVNNSSDVINGAKLIFTQGNILNDISGFEWLTEDRSLVSAELGHNGTEPTGSTTIMAHSSANGPIYGAKWSYVFGPTTDTVVNDFDGPAINTYIDRIFADSSVKSDAVKLFVPSTAKPSVGKQYVADLLWTLTNTPTEVETYDWEGNLYQASIDHSDWVLEYFLGEDQSPGFFDNDSLGKELKASASGDIGGDGLEYSYYDQPAIMELDGEELVFNNIYSGLYISSNGKLEIDVSIKEDKNGNGGDLDIDLYEALREPEDHILSIEFKNDPTHRIYKFHLIYSDAHWHL